MQVLNQNSRTAYTECVTTTVPDIEAQAKAFAALADPLRVRFVAELRRAPELSGTALAERLGISLALLCHHSRILADAGLVVKRKEGQTAYFRLDQKQLSRMVRSVLS